MKIKYVNKENSKINIYDVMKNVLHISTRLCGKLKKNDCISIVRKCESISDEYKIDEKNKNILNKDDSLIVNFDYDEDTSNIISIDGELEILYEDDLFLAVNKKPNMPVHPSMAHFTDSLSNLVRAYFDKNGIHKKTRPVNRLDRNTSGIVIFAKNEYAQEMLIQQMKTNKFSKKYIAFVYDNGLADEGTIDKPIGRKQDSIIERTTNKNELMDGYKMERAITEYKVINRFNVNYLEVNEQLKKLNNLESNDNLKANYNEIKSNQINNDENNYKYEKIAMVECNLKTGRTHQIRLHFDSIGCPLVGETLYNHSYKGNIEFPWQALHCEKVEFYNYLKLEDKENGIYEISSEPEKKEIESKIPEDMEYLVKNIKN